MVYEEITEGEIGLLVSVNTNHDISQEVPMFERGESKIDACVIPTDLRAPSHVITKISHENTEVAALGAKDTMRFCLV